MRTPSDEIQATPADLQALLLDAEGIEQFLGDVAQRAAGVLAVEGHVLHCGIHVLASPASRVLTASSDELAHTMDEFQLELDDGPCLTCLRTATTVTVSDIAGDPRWPSFRSRSQREGVTATLSLPMLRADRRAGTDTVVGALNLYTRSPGRLAGVDRERAPQFATHAAGAVALAVRLAEHEETARHLEIALRSRSTIDQAIGILMARAQVGPDAAFDILRARSQHTNTKLRDVAAGLIAEITSRQP